ncbi:MAG: tol-pal system protein YbgF [Desulfobacterales bacterium C00003060]|nr:MAG: tol-pal system protein YbgF [Desulfobacterales bacterium S3730MH5]OEU77531.1 MAG: tol-pal system protein YbgF [Desulfobacterales bacterium C00003060]
MYAKIAATWGVSLITLMISFCGCALGVDLAELNDRVIALEQKTDAEIASLRSEVTRNNEIQLEFDQASRGRQAELRALMDDIRDEVRELRGELEKGQYDSGKKMGESETRQEAYWRRQEADLQSSLDRIAQIEQYLGMEPSERTVTSDTERDESTEGKSDVEETPEGLYAKAKQLFDKGEYEDSRKLFQAFLKKYPKSEKADNAQFWLGELYYREKWYEKAILEYQKVIENYPKGNKVSGALLKQGLAFLNLDDKANARLILKELIVKYPASNEANIAKKKLKTL